MIDQAVNEVLLQSWNDQRLALKSQLVTCDTEDWDTKLTSEKPLLFGGVDLSFIKDDATRACAAYVVVQVPEMSVVYEELKMVDMTAPYVAGFLAFREAQPLLELIINQRRDRPDCTPDAILIDGNGLLHSQKFGLACHLGVLIDMPTIGVAKNLYQMNEVGLLRNEKHQNQIEQLKKTGDFFELKGEDDQDVLGIALKNCENTSKPVFVSIGHKISLETARKIVIMCSNYRVPEPVRQADMRSREHLRKL